MAHRRDLQVALAICVLGWVCGAVAAGKGRPNVILVLVDDLGWNDLSIMGSEDVKSPNIDGLMRDGVRFTDAYATASFGSASRCGVMSGIHPFHLGFQKQAVDDMEDTRVGMPLGLTILPETLKKRQYATGAVGKWQLGFTGEHHPMNRGFDHFFGFLGDRFSYTDYRDHDQVLYDDWKVFKKVTYLTNDFTDEAIRYISKNRKRPFFLYLAYNAPHAPYDYLKRDVGKGVSKARRPHVAMIHTLDRGVGRVRKHLAKLGLTKKTLIVFASDNGGHRNGSRSKPLRFFKHSLFDGGIRVHFSMTWPATIKARQKSSKLVSLLDVYPTLQAAAGVPAGRRNRKLQGVNLLQHVALRGSKRPKGGDAHKFLCVRDALGEGVIRQGQWKLWLQDRKVTALYNLKSDIGERKNVLKKNRARSKRMRRLYVRWDRKTKKQLFPNEFVPTPLRLTVANPPKKTKVRRKTRFSAKGRHIKGKRIKYRWEVFRPGDKVFADFNNVAHPASVVKVAGKAKRRATVTFKKPGKWIVRANISDGRFVKWKDSRVNVRR